MNNKFNFTRQPAVNWIHCDSQYVVHWLLLNNIHHVHGFPDP